MECIVCENAKNTEGLFEIDPEKDSIGQICRSCIRRLKSRRPNSQGCGFGSPAEPCSNPADYGTCSKERIRDPNSPLPKPRRRIDEPLLCQEHAMQLKNGAFPPWGL